MFAAKELLLAWLVRLHLAQAQLHKDRLPDEEAHLSGTIWDPSRNPRLEAIASRLKDVEGHL